MEYISNTLLDHEQFLELSCVRRKQQNNSKEPYIGSDTDVNTQLVYLTITHKGACFIE